MKEYIIKPHARERMRERSITEGLIREALRNPTKILYDENNRLLFKKLYKKGRKERLLLVAGEIKGSTLEVITVIDTSKVGKYL